MSSSILDLPSKNWRLRSHAAGYKLEVSWPNSLAAPIKVEGKSLDAMCKIVRDIWTASIRGR